MAFLKLGMIKRELSNLWESHLVINLNTVKFRFCACVKSTRVTYLQSNKYSDICLYSSVSSLCINLHSSVSCDRFYGKSEFKKNCLNQPYYFLHVERFLMKCFATPVSLISTIPLTNTKTIGTRRSICQCIQQQ